MKRLGDERFPSPRLMPALIALLAILLGSSARSVELGEVNPLIGSGGIGFGVGSQNPGPCLPFGLARPGPDTTLNGLAPSFHHCAGYHSGDNIIRGFSHTRLPGVGIADYGNIRVMPTRNRSYDYFRESSYWSFFSHRSEQASPGYYAVTLLTPRVRAELTATDHCGVHRYTFLGDGLNRIVIDARRTIMDGDVKEGWVQVDADARELSGRVLQAGGFTARGGGVEIFFVARFDRDFQDHGGFGAGHWVDLDAETPVTLAVGLSFISVDQARRHLDLEVADLDFDRVRAEAERRWSKALAVIELEGGSAEERAIFATALYHAMIMPTNFTEAGGLYRGFDEQVHRADGFTYYTDFSLWDTFRTLHPLLNLIEPKRSGDMMQSLVLMAEQGGYLPRWPTAYRYTNCMIGESADNAIADAIAKGVTNFDLAAAYHHARATALAPTPDDHPYRGRAGVLEYIDSGYVPADKYGGAASWTIESAYNDWCLAQIARALGRADDEQMFLARAKNWRNLYDPKTGYLRGKKSDGAFVSPLLPWAWTSYYVEGNARQWLWAPLHDVPGLIEIMGGEDVFVDRLEAFFKKSALRPNTLLWDNFYWHGNEPDIHAAYLFDVAGRPDLTQKWVRWVMAEKYENSPHGLDGNDDAGTLSAWYVFSALGFYPLAGSDLYLVGSPIFDRAVLHLPGGDLRVTTTADPADHPYLEGVAINGQELDAPWFHHRDIMGGGEIVFKLGGSPTNWGRVGPEGFPLK